MRKNQASSPQNDFSPQNKKVASNQQQRNIIYQISKKDYLQMVQRDYLEFTETQKKFQCELTNEHDIEIQIQREYAKFVFFSLPCKKIKLFETMMYTYRKIFDLSEWTINEEALRKVVPLFENMSEMSKANCSIFSIVKNNIDREIQVLLRPKFSYLLKLDLKYNNIKSIQCLTYLDASSLKTINLSDNKLFQIKSFGKMRILNLNHLILLDNPITEVDVYRMDLDSNKFNLVFGKFNILKAKIMPNGVINNMEFYVKIKMKCFRCKHKQNNQVKIQSFKETKYQKEPYLERQEKEKIFNRTQYLLAIQLIQYDLIRKRNYIKFQK